MLSLVKKITLWRVIWVVIVGVGLYGSYLRFFKGWEVATNLTDAQPWGIWVGIGTLCGVGLSAGGFAIAAAVYLLGMERYRPVLRASILISFLGYSTVCTGMLYELGLPWRIYHPLIYWNHRSVLFDVALCVMCYTSVLTLEFLPQVLEKLPGKLSTMLLHWHHKILIGLVLAGVLLSSMHQSFLGGLFLIMKGRIYPLWYSQYLHTLFYMSAIPAGLAVVIMGMYLSMRSLGVKLDYSILIDLSKVIVPMLSMYGIFRFVNLLGNGTAPYLFKWRMETAYFWLEILLLVIAPIALYSQERVRNNPAALYWTSAILVMGFITNRINTSITSMEFATHANYVPKWPELFMTMMMVAVAVAVFRLCVMYLDVFPRPAKTQSWLTATTPAQA
jgi:Ni/Fe-hydrogenase subunit HybB-like protein